MLRFVLLKLRDKKWMALSLLIGNILLIAIAACNPLYTHAALQRMLTRALTEQMSLGGRYPTVAAFTASLNLDKQQYKGAERILQAYDMSRSLPDELNAPVKQRVDRMYMSDVRYESLFERGETNTVHTLQLGSFEGFADHSSIVAGRMYSADLREGVIEAVVSESAMVRLNLLIDEELTLTRTLDPSGEPYHLRIVGVYRNSRADDLFWYTAPSGYSSLCVMDERLFESLFADMENPLYPLQAVYQTLLDYEGMSADQAETMAEVVAGYTELYGRASNLRFTETFSSVLTSHIAKAKQVSVTITVLQTPMFMLLAAYIFMVSKQLLQMERDEIAILKSRGAGRGQIIGIYLWQSCVLGMISAALGMPLAVGFCQALGSANNFLQFVSREPLPIEWFGGAYAYAGAAAAFSVGCMALPVIRYADVSIVDQKRKKGRKDKGPLWQRLYLDVLLLAVSLYGLYAFNTQRELLAQRVLDGAALDPLLFLCSSMFMLGAGLFAARILPPLCQLVFWAGKRLWSPAMYASFLRVLRTRHEQNFIVVFLTLTIALGLFNAQTAHTINLNEEERIRYQTGADIRLLEAWPNNAEALASEGNTDPKAIEYYEPNFYRFRELSGTALATKVLNAGNGSMRVPGGALNNIHVMGIHTKEFGETAWMKDGLLPAHWYEYLNLISQNSRAVLASQNFQDNYGYKAGDSISYRIGDGNYIRGIIYGFVPYFPTHASVVYARGTDGLARQSDNYLIVAHLSQIQATDGVKPYEVWIKTNGGSQFIYDYAASSGMSLVRLEDAEQRLVALKNDPIFQGTNGILTVSFIVALLLCSSGFLIYWVLSIKSRALQLGIFRAMGMTFREIITMLLNEQTFISGGAILAGSGIGLAASRLYIPLIQISYAAADRVLPLMIVRAGADAAKLYTVVGVVILVCLIILGVIISRMKITQALKLGED